ncbi:MAG: phosphoribosylformylglycinamidine synthase, partial [Gammaproteobacteria bacterium]|nr:phosphoribosylformylglycinamidine synthase [Gammaproteobacteria bacterium]
AMLICPGAPALSDARLERRLAAVRASNPGVTDLAASHVHVVDVEGALSAEERAVLDRLLQYGPARAEHPVQGAHRYVLPRLGTISPWSSKATDIAHICGLQRVRRIERGVMWTFAGTIGDEVALRRAIHDRMTETVLTDLAGAARLFEHHAARRLEAVPLGAAGREALVAANQRMGLALAPDEIDYLVEA